MKRISLALASLLAVAGAPQAQAHHSAGAEFDLSKTVVLKGTVAKVDWMNPHIYFHIDVKEADGSTVQWHIESIPVAFARKSGITKDMILDGGKPVELTAAPAWREQHLGWAKKLKLSDGRTIQFSGE
jgi:hypothetical protein